MRYSHLEQGLSRRSRILIHALIISGTLNLALIATFVTFVLKERRGVVVPSAHEVVKVKEVRFKNEEVLRDFAALSYDDLVRALYDETHVEEGQPCHPEPLSDGYDLLAWILLVPPDPSSRDDRVVPR